VSPPNRRAAVTSSHSSLAPRSSHMPARLLDLARRRPVFSGLLVAATATTLFAAGCTMTPRSAEAKSVATVIGSWRSKVDGLTLDLRADRSFTVRPPAESGRGPVSGRWTADESVIEFRNDADAPVCPDVPGLYDWAIHADGSLHLTLVADDCPPRQAHMDDGFTRVED
jgi:hypothetical protein